MQSFKCQVFSDNHNLLNEVTLVEDQLILPQLENQGVLIASDCREGICGTCEVKLLEGKVLNQYGEEIDHTNTDHIRPCVCYPQSDLKIELMD